MDKTCQVFVSSTFTDLKDERQAVLKAILELGHMPAGMELFPAADDSAWDLIKQVIDSSDYYVVIIGGRYGSLDEEGLGYTEREYDYATQAKKPVIPLLHEKPASLPREKTDTTDEIWRKLEAFREKIENRHTCAYWNTPEQLKGKVVLGLIDAFRRHPAAGWVRADEIPTQATIAEILKLRNRIAQLEAEATEAAVNPPPGTQDLAGGTDTLDVAYSFRIYAGGELGALIKSEFKEYKGQLTLTWDWVFAEVSPTMINESSDGDLRLALHKSFTDQAKAKIDWEGEFEGVKSYFCWKSVKGIFPMPV